MALAPFMIGFASAAQKGPGTMEWAMRFKGKRFVKIAGTTHTDVGEVGPMEQMKASCIGMRFQKHKPASKKPFYKLFLQFERTDDRKNVSVMKQWTKLRQAATKKFMEANFTVEQRGADGKKVTQKSGKNKWLYLRTKFLQGGLRIPKKNLKAFKQCIPKRLRNALEDGKSHTIYELTLMGFKTDAAKRAAEKNMFEYEITYNTIADMKVGTDRDANRSEDAYQKDVAKHNEGGLLYIPKVNKMKWYFEPKEEESFESEEQPQEDNNLSPIMENETMEEPAPQPAAADAQIKHSDNISADSCAVIFQKYGKVDKTVKPVIKQLYRTIRTSQIQYRQLNEQRKAEGSADVVERMTNEDAKETAVVEEHDGDEDNQEESDDDEKKVEENQEEVIQHKFKPRPRRLRNKRNHFFKKLAEPLWSPNFHNYDSSKKKWRKSCSEMASDKHRREHKKRADKFGN